MLIPQEHLPYFENAIYFPLLLSVLDRDRKTIEKSAIKLKQAYLDLIEGATDLILKEQKETSDYMRTYQLKLIKGETDENVTEYIFIYKGYENVRRYLNVRLRNRTEELLGVYFDMAKQK